LNYGRLIKIALMLKSMDTSLRYHYFEDDSTN